MSKTELGPWAERIRERKMYEAAVDSRPVWFPERTPHQESLEHPDEGCKEAAPLRRGQAVERGEEAHSAEARHLLSTLLALIHRDGGEYESKHGTAVAVQDAIHVVLRDRAWMLRVTELVRGVG